MDRIKWYGFLVTISAFGIFITFAGAAGKTETAPCGKMTKTIEGQVVCPIGGDRVTPAYSCQYQGKTYYFGCPACVNDFKKDPEKYTSRIKEFKVVARRYDFFPAELTVKQGDIVRIALTSEDVAHSFTIKDYGINVPVKKGEEQKIEFLADKKGTFEFRCTILCGLGHYRMKGRLVVE